MGISRFFRCKDFSLGPLRHNTASVSMTLPRRLHDASKTPQDAPPKSRKTTSKNLDFAERIGSALERLGRVSERLGTALEHLRSALEAPRRFS